MKKIINTDVAFSAVFEIKNSIIKNSAIKEHSTVFIKDNSKVSASMFKSMALVIHSNLNMTNTEGNFSCQNAAITNCNFSGYTRIMNCEVSDCTFDGINIIGDKCEYNVGFGQNIYIPTEFFDCEINFKKNEKTKIMFRNPSKVWRFNKMTLAEFLEKYWKS